jgi:uncharacterized membrane protein
MQASTESRARSLAKSFTWRIVGVVVLFIVSYLLTENVPRASAITLIFNSIQIVLYYFHERAWMRSEWGRKKGSMVWLWVYLGALITLFLVLFLFLG